MRQTSQDGLEIFEEDRLLEQLGKALIFKTPHALILTDKRGKILYTNENIARIFGYSREEIVAKPLSLFFTPEDMDFLYPNLLFLANNNQQFSGELMLIKRNGARFFAYLNMIPQIDRDICLLCIQDIDDIKRLRQTINLGNYDELVKMASGIAHEIRNPLVSIGGFINRIWKLCDLEEQNLKYYESVITNLNRIETILKKVNLFVTLPKPEFNLWNIREIVENAIESKREEISKKGIKVYNLVDEKRLYCDYQLLKTCFSMLIQNSADAIDHDQGEIRIWSDGDDNFLKVFVSDNGRGITANDLPYIFVPFFSTKAHGIGIDLPIVKKVIQGHNGLIKVSSTPNQGTLFEISLPIERRRRIRRELFGSLDSV